MEIDELIGVLKPHVYGFESLMGFHELMPAALPEHADELTASFCVELSERIKTVVEAGQAKEQLAGRMVTRLFAKGRQSQFEETRARSEAALVTFLKHQAPKFWATACRAPAESLAHRLSDVPPPSW